MTHTLIGQLVVDLLAEGQALDELVAALPEQGWRRPTPAAGWTIAHQIAHLAWTDDAAELSARDPDGFGAMARTMMSGPDPESVVDQAAQDGAATPPAQLLARWRAGRSALAEALLAVPAAAKLPWFGPPMSAASMATARLMETWAHGLDVADALGAAVVPTARLRHVARLAVRTRDFSFRTHGRTAPALEFRVELTAPDGHTWAFGPADAEQRVSGPALDLCLVAVQRRHRRDTALVAEGPEADAWLDLAQAFAGPPGPGREPMTELVTEPRPEP